MRHRARWVAGYWRPAVTGCSAPTLGYMERARTTSAVQASPRRRASLGPCVRATRWGEEPANRVLVARRTRGLVDLRCSQW